MEIPAKYILTIEEVEINKYPGTEVVHEQVPFIGRKHGRVYSPEVTGVSCYVDPEYILRELMQDELGLLVGPYIDRRHFDRTGELKVLELPETSVLFWDSYHEVEVGGRNV